MSEIPNKLYRFYSLRPSSTNSTTGLNSDLIFLKSVLLSQNFICKQFYEFNDPMEGMYKSKFSILEKDIFKLKQSLYISCFTKDYRNPLMWSHYANGFQGLAIEILVNKKCSHVKNLKKIVYSDAILEYNPMDTIDYIKVLEILTHKLKYWEYEKEFRFISSSTNYFYKLYRNKIEAVRTCYIGKINKVFIGSPYREAHNFDSIKEASNCIKQYMKIKSDLIKYLELIKIPYEVVTASDIVHMKTVKSI